MEESDRSPNFLPPPSAEELERIRSKWMDTNHMEGDPTRTEVQLLLSTINLMMERQEASNGILAKTKKIKRHNLRMFVGKY